MTILREALAMLPDVEGPPPEPPTIDEEMLRRAAMEWLAALRELVDVEGRDVLVVMKVARIADGDAEIFRFDTVPNLLLLERTLDEVSLAVECARAHARPTTLDRFDDRDRTLRRLLAPLVATIPREDRAALAALARAGMAPSPFAVR